LAGALAGLVVMAAGQGWGDPVAGLAVTLFICHVGYEATTDMATTDMATAYSTASTPT
jgi:divalent metal cation (Fe/Co/Zn/Cd) transporter